MDWVSWSSAGMLSTRIYYFFGFAFFYKLDLVVRPLMIIAYLNFLLNLSHGVRSFVMFIKIYGESNQLQLQALVGYDWVLNEPI